MVQHLLDYGSLVMMLATGERHVLFPTASNVTKYIVGSLTIAHFNILLFFLQPIAKVANIGLPFTNSRVLKSKSPI